MNKQRKVLITTTYNEMGIIIDTKAEELGSSAQLGTDTISRQAAIGCLRDGQICGDYCKKAIEQLPPAQQNLSEEYAKAVRNWLVNYQIKCAELNGRYTPYEVLGWIVSDWRKENGIW